MRSRNKKWALPYLKEQTKFVCLDIKNKGQWKQLFKKDVINVEIGFGKASYITQMSNIYKDQMWIGIERDISTAATGIKKHIEQFNDNIMLIVNDANYLKDIFEDKEINNIYLNFSDPWPKKAHSKRRLTSNTYIENYYDLLNSNGTIIMKTDNKELFEYSLVNFLSYNFILDYISVDYRRVEQEDPITEYEQRYIDLNQPIYKFIIKKG